MSEPADFMRKLAEESARSMVPADPWSGIPDDLRKLVQDLGGRFADFGTWKGYYAAGGGRDTVNNSPGRTVELARHMNDIDAARDALCAALRELVADRERLDWLTGQDADTWLGRGFAVDTDTWSLHYGRNVIIGMGRTPREAIDSSKPQELLWRATPGGVKEGSRMTVAEIESRIAHIAKMAEDDNEQAHLDEDALYLDVLRAIAAGAPDAAALAQAALKATKLDHDRWYA